jgi:hypothetical protein
MVLEDYLGATVGAYLTEPSFCDKVSGNLRCNKAILLGLHDEDGTCGSGQTQAGPCIHELICNIRVDNDVA